MLHKIGGCYDIAKSSFKKRSSTSFTLNGKTTDGKNVYGNVLKILESRGIPLEMALEYIDSQNGVVDWVEFIDTSLVIGWKLKSTINRIHTACVDVYGKEYAEQVVDRLKIYVTRKYEAGML